VVLVREYEQALYLSSTLIFNAQTTVVFIVLVFSYLLAVAILLSTSFNALFIVVFSMKFMADYKRM